MAAITALRVVGFWAEVTPRSGLRSYGVPEGGPWDPRIGQIVNMLGGGTVYELVGTAHLAFDVPGTLITVGLDSHPDGRSRAGLEAVVQAGRRGARGWVAWTPERLPIVQIDVPRGEEGPIRLVPGRDAQLVGGGGQVHTSSSRMGLRVPLAAHPHAVELRSQPTMPGMVQATPDGTLIILGPEAPTIGGYPIVGFVAEADLPRVARLRAGDPVRFKFVDEEEEREAALLARRALALWLSLLRLGLAP